MGVWTHSSSSLADCKGGSRRTVGWAVNQLAGRGQAPVPSGSEPPHSSAEAGWAHYGSRKWLAWVTLTIVPFVPSFSFQPAGANCRASLFGWPDMWHGQPS